MHNADLNAKNEPGLVADQNNKDKFDEFNGVWDLVGVCKTKISDFQVQEQSGSKQS